MTSRASVIGRHPVVSHVLIWTALCSAMFCTFTAMETKADLAIRPSGDHGVRITLAEDESKVQINPALIDKTWADSALRIKAGETRTKEKVGQMFVTVTS